MATKKQELGELGEYLVTKKCDCPKCKRKNTLRQLRKNFKCADIICDFCGFLAQVKARRTANIESVPSTILGAAWGPQKERMDAGNYFSLYIVFVNKDNPKDFSIFFLPAELQEPEMFVPRKPLSETARRAGWQASCTNSPKKQKGIQ